MNKTRWQLEQQLAEAQTANQLLVQMIKTMKSEGYNLPEVMIDDTLSQKAIKKARALTSDQLEAIAEYLSDIFTAEQAAFDAAFDAAKDIERMVLNHVFLPKTNNQEQIKVYFDELIRLVDVFAKKASHYHALLILEHPKIYGVSLQPNLQGAAMWMELQASIRTNLNIVINDHSRIGEFADFIKQQPLHRDFARVIQALRRKEKSFNPAKMLIGEIALEIGVKPRKAYITGLETFDELKRRERAAKSLQERSRYTDAIDLLQEYVSKRDSKATMGWKRDNTALGVFIAEAVDNYERYISDKSENK